MKRNDFQSLLRRSLSRGIYLNFLKSFRFAFSKPKLTLPSQLLALPITFAEVGAAEHLEQLDRDAKVLYVRR